MTTTQLEEIQKLLASMASSAIGIGSLDTTKYLAYKRAIAQSSSLENLNVIVKNLMEEIFS